VTEAQNARPPLFVIKGDATDEEVAALTAVLQAMAAAGAAARAAEKRPRPEWSAPRRGLRQPQFHGPGGWRASSLPR
jgi:acyl-CoA carboxylase epsilon subunit